MTEHPSTASQNLRTFRLGLIALKEDRTTYIRSSNVLAHYQELCAHFRAHEERFGTFETQDPKAKTHEQLECEHLLSDCFLLVSLLFLTIGKTLEPPATYAKCLVVKRLLRHLTESGNFSNRDLITVHQTLKQCRETISKNGSSCDLRVLLYLGANLDECVQALKPLQDALDKISPQLLSVHEKLVSLRRCIKAAEAKKRFSAAEVQGYLDQIRKIDATRINGKFVGDDGSIPEDGQEQVKLVLDRCYIMSDEALVRKGAISPGLSAHVEKLSKIKYRLEKLELTQAWSLRETDLYEFLVTLIHIDDRRVNNRFVAADGSTPEEGQSILLYLLRRSYAHCYTLVISSEPVSEALTPIFNQLQTVRRCLKEVQKFGIQDPRELYPYSMKLNSIDNMKVDGKFMVGNDIPEGQGRVASLLAECFEICQELRTDERLEEGEGDE